MRSPWRWRLMTIPPAWACSPSSAPPCSDQCTSSRHPNMTAPTPCRLHTSQILDGRFSFFKLQTHLPLCLLPCITSSTTCEHQPICYHGSKLRIHISTRSCPASSILNNLKPKFYFKTRVKTSDYMQLSWLHSNLVPSQQD
ncbi:hypothetical protein KC19_VG066100 [Ceratodon purpureus]|uniref:Secreted protein n=1 Tax=Ceratodon purpureus TaxID=3225 RepID=A0A8T0HMN4_CERPU|nr:hypothetical protein KC19_VG066100 [Ceratodon purpureus]